jgi:hypothetical protein
MRGKLEGYEVGSWKYHEDCPGPVDDPDGERRHAEAEDIDIDTDAVDDIQEDNDGVSASRTIQPTQ